MVSNSADGILNHFSYFSKKIDFEILCKLAPNYFSQKIDFGIPCKLSLKKIICTECKSLFSGKKKKQLQNAVC